MSPAVTPSNDNRLKTDQPRENGSRPGRGGRGRGRGGRGGGGNRGRGRGRGGSPTVTDPEPLGSQVTNTTRLIDRLGPPPHLATDLPTPVSATPFPHVPSSPTPSATSSRNRRNRKSSAASTLSVSVPGANARSRNKDNSPKTRLPSISKDPVVSEVPNSILPVPPTNVVVANAATHLLSAPDIRAASPQPQPASRPYTPVGIDWAGDDDDDGSLPDLDDWGLTVKPGSSDAKADVAKTDSLHLELQEMTLAEVPVPKPKLQGESHAEQDTRQNGPAPSAATSIEAPAATQGSSPSQVNGSIPIPSLPPKPTPATIERSYPTPLKSFDQKNRNNHPKSDVTSTSHSDPQPHSLETITTPSLSLLPPTPPTSHRTTGTRSTKGHSRNSSIQGNDKGGGDGGNERAQSPSNLATPSLGAEVPAPALGGITIHGVARSPPSSLSSSRPLQKPTENSRTRVSDPASSTHSPLNGSPLAGIPRDPAELDEPQSPTARFGGSGRGGHHRGGHDGNPFGNFHSAGRGSHHGHPRGSGFHASPPHNNQRAGGRGGNRARTHSNASSTAGSSPGTPAPGARRGGAGAGSDDSTREGASHGHARSLSRPIISQSALSRLTSTLSQSPPKRSTPSSSSPTPEPNPSKNTSTSGTLQVGLE